MLQFIKSLPRLAAVANRDAGRHFSMTFSSALSIAVALLISMVMITATANLDTFSRSIESEIVVQVSLLPTLTDAQKEEVKSQLAALEGAGEITYSSADEELEKLIEENGSVFSQYAGENRNPLFDVYIIQVEDASQAASLAESAQTIEGISSASYGGSTIDKAARLFSAVRTGSWILVGLMILLAVFLTRTTVKMAIHLRKDEIAIMRTVGAYNWYILTPFVFEGLIIGFWGALLPAILCDIGYPVLYTMLDGVFLSEMFPLLSPWPLCLEITLVLFAIGLCAGMTGSWLAVRKYLKWIR